MRPSPAARMLAWKWRPSARLALAASGWFVLGLTPLPIGGGLRTVAAFIFLLACPGAAVVRHWPSEDGLERCVLAVGVSMALTMVVAETLIVTHAWSAPVALATLAVFTTVGALLPVSPRRERRRAR
jgi:uncharacterized membrane protein